MTTKFNVGDEVYVRCKVIGISSTDDGTSYLVEADDDTLSMKFQFSQEEYQLISADVEDFRRENPSEKD